MIAEFIGFSQNRKGHPTSPSNTSVWLQSRAFLRGGSQGGTDGDGGPISRPREWPLAHACQHAGRRCWPKLDSCTLSGLTRQKAHIRRTKSSSSTQAGIPQMTCRPWTERSALARSVPSTYIVSSGKEPWRRTCTKDKVGLTQD